MTYIVDRIEGEYAVLEDEQRNMADVPLSDLPGDVQAGDVLSWDENGYRIDQEAGEQRRKRIREKMDRLWK